MARYGRDAEDIQLDIADAVGQDADVLEYLRCQARARGWGGSDDGE